MRAATAFALAAAIAPCMAQAQVITQQQDYFFDANVANEPVALSFDAFDTMGGTRTLDRVGIEVQSFFSLNIIAENGEDYALTANDWWFDVALSNNIAFNPGQAGEVNFFGVGGTGYGPLSADLEASDGVAQEGPDSHFFAFKDEYAGSRDALAFQIGAFEGQGQIDAQIYPYLGISLPPPPPFFDLWIAHSNFGSVTLTYEYTTVPAPASLGLVALSGIAAARRRRG